MELKMDWTNWTIADDKTWNQLNMRGKIFVAGIPSLIIYFLTILTFWGFVRYGVW